MNSEQLELVLETALLCANEPMSANELTRLFLEEVPVADIEAALADIQAAWSEKGMELCHLATGWRFQSHLALS